MVEFFNLEEAARFFGISQDEMKQLAKREGLRVFQDRGTLRFRADDIKELFRKRGGSSDPELPLGEAPKPTATDSPPPAKAKKDGEVFDFSLDTDDAVQIGQEIHPERKSKSDSKGPASPAPKPGSDSDVRLVSDGSDLDFQIASDSDVKIVDDAGPKSMPPGGPRSPAPGGPKSPAPGSKSSLPGSKPQSGLGPKRKTGAHMDSGVKLVNLDSDSDVKIIGHDESDVTLTRPPGKGATDSDIRLEPDSGKGKAGKKSGYEPHLTEEIDLDAEIRKAEEAARGKTQPAGPSQAKAKPPEFPTTSPFELSETEMRVSLPEPTAAPKPKAPKPDSSDDFDLAPKKEDSSDFDLTPAKEDSSDFDLTPAPGDSSSPLELGSDEFQLEVSDDNEVGLGDLPAAKGHSGINLKDPADSGISLEQGGEGSDEIEFELSLDAETTPKPAPPGKSEVDSDSEFELTVDESGGLAPIEEEAATAEDKDIFETDFEVPALEEESGSEAMALEESDTDLDSSDFDIALTDSDIASEDESGSQVVALDEEAEEAAAPPPKKKKGTVLLDAEESSSGIDELMGGEEEEQPEEEEEEEPVAAAAGPAVAAPPAEWGYFAPITLLLTVAVMVLVGFLGFEMIQGVMGYQKPGVLTTQLAKIFNIKLPPQ
jgi:hypothetical protein